MQCRRNAKCPAIAGKECVFMKKKWNILLYILAVVLIVGGLLALWLPNRSGEENADATRPDTDPDAPFADLPEWEKAKVLKAIKSIGKNQKSPGYVLTIYFGTEN